MLRECRLKGLHTESLDTEYGRNCPFKAKFEGQKASQRRGGGLMVKGCKNFWGWWKCVIGMVTGLLIQVHSTAYLKRGTAEIKPQ